ncbi:MAG: DUF504 domain-containing protein [Nitrososphaeria archaeon]
MGRRKGRLEEALSRAIHADDPELYTVIYRDMDSLREMGLMEFLAESEDFSRVPASRIVEVRRGNEVVYRAARAGRPGIGKRGR